MAGTPEHKVKQKVKAVLAGYSNLYQYWPVPTGFGEPSLDCIGSYRGRFFAIETKAPGKKLTKYQLLTSSKIHQSGAPVFIIGHERLEDGSYSGLAELKQWLDLASL